MLRAYEQSFRTVVCSRIMHCSHTLTRCWKQNSAVTTRHLQMPMIAAWA
jgi:hypothetical protein